MFRRENRKHIGQFFITEILTLLCVCVGIWTCFSFIDDVKVLVREASLGDSRRRRRRRRRLYLLLFFVFIFLRSDSESFSLKYRFSFVMRVSC